MDCSPTRGWGWGGGGGVHAACQSSSPAAQPVSLVMYAHDPQEESLRMARAPEVQEQLHRTPDVDLPPVGGATAIGDEGSAACRLQEFDNLMTGGAAVGAAEAEQSIMRIQC